ncbi:putative stearoyl-[acyl-carrier-protein] 9-desaturase [Dioscorea sansibarensis]
MFSIKKFLLEYNGLIGDPYCNFVDFRTRTDPYLAFIYTSFQERLTFVAHTNIARQAKMYGDTTLAKICGTIAADEKRHELAYTKIIDKLFEIDPNTTMLSMAEMMRKRINMPVRVLFDGRDHDLALHLNMITQKTGSYTVKDYGDVLDFFIQRWHVEEITGLSDKGRQAQEYICGFLSSIRKLEERAQDKSSSGRTSKMRFSWIFNKEVVV